ISGRRARDDKKPAWAGFGCTAIEAPGGQPVASIASGIRTAFSAAAAPTFTLHSWQACDWRCARAARPSCSVSASSLASPASAGARLFVIGISWHTRRVVVNTHAQAAASATAWGTGGSDPASGALGLFVEFVDNLLESVNRRCSDMDFRRLAL